MLGAGRAGDEKLGARVLTEELTPRGPKMGKVDGVGGGRGQELMEGVWVLTGGLTPQGLDKKGVPGRGGCAGESESEVSGWICEVVSNIDLLERLLERGRGCGRGCLWASQTNRASWGLGSGVVEKTDRRSSTGIRTRRISIRERSTTGRVVSCLSEAGLRGWSEL